MITQPDDGTDASRYARVRVSDADREHATDMLKEAFAEGRLTQSSSGTSTSSLPAGEQVQALPGGGLRRSLLPSGWTPIELLKHVAYDELRWLEWRFDGRPVADPRGEDRDGRWYVADGETLEELVAALHAQAAGSRASVESHDLADIGPAATGGRSRARGT